MAKYGFLQKNSTQANIQQSDINGVYSVLTGATTFTKDSYEFFAVNMYKKWAYSGPSFHELLRMNAVKNDDTLLEDFYEADYSNFGVGDPWDAPESGKGSFVDMNGTTDEFVASYPTLIDYTSWEGPVPVSEDAVFREVGGARTFKKNGSFASETTLLPPTELYKTRTFKHSEFGLRAIAHGDNYIVTSAYLHSGAGQDEAQETPSIGSIFVYEKLPDGDYVFRHEIECQNTTRAPFVQIYGDELFVGNYLNHEVKIYSLSEISSNQKLTSKNETAPKQILESDTDWGKANEYYGSYIHCRDGEHLFIGVDNGRIEQSSVTLGDYSLDCGYVDVYKKSEAGVWEKFTRIIPNDLDQYIPDEVSPYGFDPADIQFGYSIFHKKDDTGKEYVAIGSPRANIDTEGGDDFHVYAGAVYIVQPTYDSNGEITSFSHVQYIAYDSNWESNFTNEATAEYEFGRSVLFDDDFSLWTCGNPRSGSIVVRIPHTVNSWNDTNATSVQISTDRLGGVLTTNGTDVIYGGPFKLRVFEKTTTNNPESLKMPQESETKIQQEPTQALQVKPFPSEWGAPPTRQTSDIVELPFGYGNGSSTVSAWILQHSTGDMRTTEYLRHVDSRKPKQTGEIDYHELWRHGNPTIQIKIGSSIGGKINASTRDHGEFVVEEGKMMRYKSATRSTIELKVDGELDGVSVYWNVNGVRSVGNTYMALMVSGEDMNVEVTFTKDKFAVNDTPELCAYTRRGETKIIERRSLHFK
tara:strand:+ start:628 stop:2880 length:2253 start_codon:yes stop_codon:yes gene_type:complete